MNESEDLMHLHILSRCLVSWHRSWHSASCHGARGCDWELGVGRMWTGSEEVFYDQWHQKQQKIRSALLFCFFVRWCYYGWDLWSTEWKGRHRRDKEIKGMLQTKRD